MATHATNDPDVTTAHPKKSNIAAYLASIGLFAVGLAAMALTIKMNVQFGETVALTEQGKLIRKGVSIVLDCAGPILILTAAVLSVQKRRWLGYLALICGLLFQVYTGWNLVGFGASERIGAQHQRERVAANASEQAKDAAKEAQSIRANTLKWMQQTAVAAKSSDDKKAMLKEVATQAERNADAAIKSGIPSQSNASITLAPDAHASVMGSLIGWTDARVQIADAIAIAVGLVLLKSLCLYFAILIWPRKVALPIQDKAANTNEPPTKTRAPRQIVSAPVAASIMAPIQATTPDTSNIVQLDDKHTRRKKAVARFLAEATQEKPGAKVTAEAFYSAYNTWARKNACPTLKQNMFGRLCGVLNVARRRDQMQTLYVDRALIPQSARAAHVQQAIGASRPLPASFLKAAAA